MARFVVEIHDELDTLTLAELSQKVAHLVIEQQQVRASVAVHPLYASSTDEGLHLIADIPGEDTYRIS